MSTRARGRRSGAEDYAHLRPLLEEFAQLLGDGPRRKRLREELVNGYLPLAEHVAQRFSGRGVAKEDLVQVARLGLVNAVDRYDPAKGGEFLAFAVPTVMGEVRRYFRDAGWTLRVPRRLKDLYLSISNANATLSQRYGRAPTPSEIAEYADLSLDDVHQGLDVGHAYYSMSLDEVISGETNDLELGDTLGEQDSAFEGVENHEALKPLLDQLPERERTILVLRFTHSLTQTQIAQRVGISQMHVSRLLSHTLRQLREGMLNAPTDGQQAEHS